MTTAQLVNRITDKLSTGRVVFEHIDSDAVVFTYGLNCYRASILSGRICVIRHTRNGFELLSDSYTRWIAGVLNGKVLDDHGEFLDELTAIAQKNGEYDV